MYKKNSKRVAFATKLWCCGTRKAKMAPPKKKEKERRESHVLKS
jgi:hypothetical protein